MKLKLFFLILALAFGARVEAGTLTYEGKTIAQVARDVSIPFSMLVDQVFAGIGQDVAKNQKLLEYHLKPAQARHLQHEIMTSGGLSDIKVQLAGAEQEQLDINGRKAVAGELAAKGLGSASEASRNARSAFLSGQKVQGAREKLQAQKSNFDLRLLELEEYLGHRLKPGQKLPQEMFLLAPIAGTIVEMAPQARPEGILGDNQVAAVIAALNPIQVQILVYETEIPKLHVGQPVSIELASDQSVKFAGKISMLSWKPTDSTIAVPSFYLVHIDVENPEHILKPGYKVYAKIDVD